MTNEMKAWLDTIEPVDISETRKHLEAIREKVRNELTQETKHKCNHPQGTVCSICSPFPTI